MTGSAPSWLKSSGISSSDGIRLLAVWRLTSDSCGHPLPVFWVSENPIYGMIPPFTTIYQFIIYNYSWAFTIIFDHLDVSQVMGVTSVHHPFFFLGFRIQKINGAEVRWQRNGHHCSAQVWPEVNQLPIPSHAEKSRRRINSRLDPIRDPIRDPMWCSRAIRVRS